MFSKPTVLVLGAGAHFEFGMPLGESLFETVATNLNFRYEVHRLAAGDYHLHRILKRVFKGDECNSYMQAGRRIAQVRAAHNSIDSALNYLSDEPKSVIMGKVGIVHAILRAERSSPLEKNQESGRYELDKVDGSWVRYFFALLIEGAKRHEVSSAFDHLTVINFNYDRCLEHYIYRALQSRGLVHAEEAGRIVSAMNHIRPYGRIAPLEWQSNESAVPFGGPATLDDRIFDWAEGIRTFTEQQNRKVHQRIETALNQAFSVVFLGFGFHQSNMVLFEALETDRSSTQFVFGTVFGIPENKKIIDTYLSSTLQARTVLLDNLKAADLLRKYGTSIQMVSNL